MKSFLPASGPLLQSLVEQRLSRRGVTRLLLGAAGAALAGPAASALAAPAAAPSSLDFKSLRPRLEDNHRVAEGYEAKLLIRWGDPLTGPADDVNPGQLTAAEQAKRFGYCNDYVAFLPFPDDPDRALLHVNHEFTLPRLMFPDLTAKNYGPQHVAVERAAVGGSVLEIRRHGNSWQLAAQSKYARRITADTPMRVSGPAAGHARLRTAADPSGRKVLGTLANCAGGKTPWGTVLMAEENFNKIMGNPAPDSPDRAMHKRMQIRKETFGWYLHDKRFDLTANPNEFNRFGWLVEYDPFDPQSVPVKRTALGRFKHESGTCVANADGRVVVYSGDDERFEYFYRFVTKDRIVPGNKAKNRDLLDEGTLYVARFDKDGLTWLPLVYGQGPLTAENGFHSQADVVIDARRAGDFVGATRMDRPEDVEISPTTGRVYVTLTNNDQRTANQIDPANPRASNIYGHILEMTPPSTDNGSRDHTAPRFEWDVLLMGGDPEVTEAGARYHPQTESWLACPDNLAFDAKGRLWIATDQGTVQRSEARPDGLFACDLEGDGRANVKCFFTGPKDAEMTGPEFSADGKNLFLGVQHPGEGLNSTFDEPTSRWPDFRAGVPPRSAMLVFARQGGGPIGG